MDKSVGLISSFSMPEEIRIPMPRNPARDGFADIMFESLATQIESFQKTLAADEEVGACLASFGQQITISVMKISFQNPHLMLFFGVNPDGQQVTLMQHTTQVNLLLTPVKVVSRKANRIGFKSSDSYEVVR